MKYATLILLIALLGAGAMFAQKSNVKGDAAATDPAGAGKAAVRAGALMQASRDSLRSSDLQPSTTIVDTFFNDDVLYWGKSYLKKSEIVAVEKRLKEDRALYALSEQQYLLAQKDPRFTAAQLQTSKGKLDDHKAHLEAAEAKIKAIRKDWEAVITSSKPISKDEPSAVPPQK
jgi:hypothetical protein